MKKIAIILLVITIPLYYLLGTQSGLIFDYQLAKKFIPGELNIEGLRGRLIGHLAFDTLQYSYDGIEISAGEFSLSWKMPGLVHRYISIQNIQAKDITVNLTSAKSYENQSADDNVDIETYLSIVSWFQVQKLAVRNINVNQDNQSVFRLNQFTIEPESEENQIIVLDSSIASLSGNYQVSSKPEITRILKLNNVRVDLRNAGSELIRGNLDIALKHNVIEFRQFDFNYGTGQVRVDGSIGQGEQFNIILSHLLFDDISIPSVRIESVGTLNSDLQAKSTIIFDGQNKIIGNIRLSPFNLSNILSGSVAGNYVISFNNLDILNSFLSKIKQIQSLRGQLGGEITIAGKLIRPSLIANIELVNGSAFIPAAGMKLRDLIFRLNYRQNKPVKFYGNLNIGKGSATLRGQAAFENDILSSDFELQGDNLLIADTDEYKVIVSPDIRVEQNNNDIKITGSIFIPKAELAPVDFTSTTTLPSDVIIVNQKPKSNPLSNLALAVNVKLGDEVSLDFYNLKAKLRGGLHIMQIPGSAPTGTGELYTVAGSYKAYGKDLIIEQGHLIYTGNLLTNPGISLKAYENVRRLAGQRQFESMDAAEQLSVGILVKGTLNKPRITFYSNPPGLSQGDMMSYLILGQPQSEAAGAGAMTALSMAAGMGGADTGGMTSGLQDTLGLSEMGVGSTEYYNPETSGSQSSTTVNLGRNLGHHLSLHYSVGLFDPVSILSIRYKINRFFSLQTETSTIESGGDILYHIESRD